MMNLIFHLVAAGAVFLLGAVVGAVITADDPLDCEELEAHR
jgi:hypothetical protein